MTPGKPQPAIARRGLIRAALLPTVVCFLLHGVAAAQLIGGGRVADRPFSKALAEFGESIAWSSVSGLADVLIVVDTGATMMERTQSGSNRVKSAADAFPFLATRLLPAGAPHFALQSSDSSMTTAVSSASSGMFCAK